MGQQRNKSIDTAVDLEKLSKIEKESENKAAIKAGKKPSEKPPKFRSKRYKLLVDFIDKNKEYSIVEAVSIIKKTSDIKFESKIEAHLNLGFSKDKSDQKIRTNVTLPHQSSVNTKSRKKKILIFSSKGSAELKKLGAEIGDESTIKDIEKGIVPYDQIIADSSWMPKLGKVAKVLGPKGLMPSPKSGTVTDDPVSLIKEFAKGKLEIRTETSPIIHTIIGSISMDQNKLEENFSKLIETVKSNKPEGLKKELFKSVYLSSTMGPSVKINLKTL